MKIGQAEALGARLNIVKSIMSPKDPWPPFKRWAQWWVCSDGTRWRVRPLVFGYVLAVRVP